MEDLRGFIKRFERETPKEFVRVKKEVDPKYEISAIIKKPDLLGKHPMVFFGGGGARSCNQTFPKS